MDKKDVEKRDRQVRVRIAPSPTGFAHVGTAYTALFNFAFAKKNKGKFILRLEDTDIKREVKGAEQAIYDALSWLGLSWDEGPKMFPRSGRERKFAPYRQSQRLDIYKKKAEKLLKGGFAYKEKGAIRFRNPGKDVGWNDLIRGSITFPGGEITDFVIIKGNGYPTYNFAVVVDDLSMKISHVIRGEEHISNTPRQLALYSAFEEDPPEFAHLPTIRNKERKKLSKRRDPVDIKKYRKEGYLPEALVNFLCLLGWSHPQEKEIFSLNEFVELFDIERVRKAGPIFNVQKLDWINGQYIQKLSDEKFVEKIKPFVPKSASVDKILQITPLIKTRLKKFSDFDFLARPLFIDPGRPSRTLLKGVNRKHLRAAYDSLSRIDETDWNSNFDSTVLEVVDKNKFKTGDFFMSLRIAVFSSNTTPPINDSMKFLGKEKALKRLKGVLNL